MLTRRSFMSRLASGLIVTAAASAGLPALAESPHPSRSGTRLDELVPLIDPSLSIINQRTKEELKLRFFTVTGYDRTAIDQLNWIFRDWRQKEEIQIDVRLFWGLAAVRQAAMKDGDAGDILLTSGYRSRKTNDMLRSQGHRTAYNSFHMKGRAADFRLPGAKIEDTARFVEWLQVGGTGHYRDQFVHMDSGEERTWLG